jgi:hypothetical protein
MANLKTQIDLLASAVAKNYLANSATTPDVIIAKLSVDNGLNHNEVKRLVERSNQLIQIKMFENNQVEFPMARIENVMEYIRTGEGPNKVSMSTNIKQEYTPETLNKDDWLMDDIDWGKVDDWVEPQIQKTASDNKKEKTKRDYFAETLSLKDVNRAVDHIKLAEDEFRVTDMQQKMKVREIEENTKKIIQKIPPKQLEAILISEIEKENLQYEEKSKAKKIIQKIIEKAKKALFNKTASEHMNDENLKNILKGIKSDGGYEKLAYKKAIENEVEERGADKTYESLMKIANLNYFKDTIRSDIKTAEMSINNRKKQEKIASVLETGSITDEQQKLLYNVYEVSKGFNKIANLQEDTLNNAKLIKTALDHNIIDEDYFEKVAANAMGKTIDSFFENSKHIPLYSGAKGAITGAATSGAITGFSENSAYKKRQNEIKSMYEQGKITNAEKEKRLNEARKQYMGSRLKSVALGAATGGAISAGNARFKMEKYKGQLKGKGLDGDTLSAIAATNKSNAQQQVVDELNEQLKRNSLRGSKASGIIGGMMGAMTGPEVPDYNKNEKY